MKRLRFFSISEEGHVLIIWWLALVFFGDFVSKFFWTFINMPDFPRIGGGIKVISMFSFISIIIYRNKSNKALAFFFVLLTCFIISELTSKASFSLDKLLDNIYFLLRYCFVFVFVSFLPQLKIKDLGYKKIFIFLNWLGTINFILIVVGLFFDLNLFKTYPFSERFGFNGLIIRSSLVFYLYAFLIYINYKEKNYMLVLLFLISIILAGGKAAFLFIFLFILIELYRNIRKVFFFILLFLGVLFSFYFKNILLEISFFLYPFGREIYTSNGIISFLTSYRIDLVLEHFFYYKKNWWGVNILVGGYHPSLNRIQFEFLELFSFFGLVGIITYTLFLKTFFYTQRTKYFLFLVLTVSFFVGNLFSNVLAPCLLYLLIKYQDKIKEHKEYGFN